MNNMNGYDNSKNNDYRAPYLQLDKQQMSDPFGWLQSQGSVNVRAILKQMKLDDRMIDCLLKNYCPDESKAQAFANYRQNIGRKAIQAYKKWQWDNELKEGKQTAQLKKIVAESVKKVLEEGAADYDMSPEAVSVRNGNLRGVPQYINPQNLKTDIEQLIHYLMVSEGDSPRAQKAYQKALEIKQDIFNKIDLISKE